jgi:hypothetical protein
MTTTIAKYAEDPNTIHLFPEDLYRDEKDLSLDCGIEIDEICTEIYEACKGWSYDATRLIKVLGNTTGVERKKISLRYKELKGKTLTQKMINECGNSDFGVATQFLSVGPVEAECMMLKKAMDGFGSDKIMLYSILCGRSNEDITLLKTTYYKFYTEDLAGRVASECGGDLKVILSSALQGAEETFDPDFHTQDKAIHDAKDLYKAGQGSGWFSADNALMSKIVVLSPPKYLKMLNGVYADKYGYTLIKAFEKEMSAVGGEAAMFTLGMKLKPFDTIATLIKKATRGIGTNELLLTTCLIRYQDLMGNVHVAHEALFEKSIHKRVKDEVSGYYQTLLLALLDKVLTM